MTTSYRDYFFFKKEELKRERQKELLKIFRWSLTELSKINCKTISVNARIDITEDKKIEVIVFEKDGTNCSMNLYDFYETKRSINSLKRFIAAIKTDDFANVKAQSQA